MENNEDFDFEQFCFELSKTQALACLISTALAECPLDKKYFELPLCILEEKLFELMEQLKTVETAQLSRQPG